MASASPQTTLRNIAVDATGPIVRVRYLATPDDDEVETLLVMYEELASSRECYGIALATTPSARQTTAQNRRTGEWMKHNHARYEGRLRGMAFVSTSAMMRFSLSVIFLVQPLTVPYVVVANDDDADAFLWSKIEAAFAKR